MALFGHVICHGRLTRVSSRSFTTKAKDQNKSYSGRDFETSQNQFCMKYNNYIEAEGARHRPIELKASIGAEHMLVS